MKSNSSVNYVPSSKQILWGAEESKTQSTTKTMSIEELQTIGSGGKVMYDKESLLLLKGFKNVPPPEGANISVIEVRKGGGNKNKKSKKQRVVPILSEEETIVRDSILILNKIAPETKEKLTKQLIALHLTKELLLQITEKIFEKALLEPKYCDMYSELCYSLIHEGKSAELSSAFRVSLLRFCRNEFVKRKSHQYSEDPKIRAEEDFKIRLRMRGNMEFVGALYKRQLLREKVIKTCFEELLATPPDNTNLEAFCKLISSAGEMFSARNVEFTDKMFKDLYELSTCQDLEPRIRFMILDVIELRGNGWRSRLKKVVAKTIKEVHKEAAQEKYSRSQALRASTNAISSRDYNRANRSRMNRSVDVLPASGTAIRTWGSFSSSSSSSSSSKHSVQSNPTSPYVTPPTTPTPSSPESDGWSKVTSKTKKTKTPIPVAFVKGGRGKKPKSSFSSRGSNRNNNRGNGNGNGNGKFEREANGSNFRSSRDSRDSTHHVKKRENEARNGAETKETGTTAVPESGAHAVMEENDFVGAPDALLSEEKEINDVVPELKEKEKKLEKISRTTALILQEYFAAEEAGLSEAKECFRELIPEPCEMEEIGFLVSGFEYAFQNLRKYENFNSLLTVFLTDHLISCEALTKGILNVVCNLDEISEEVPRAADFLGKSAARFLPSFSSTANLSSFPPLISELSKRSQTMFVAGLFEALEALDGSEGSEPAEPRDFQASGFELWHVTSYKVFLMKKILTSSNVDSCIQWVHENVSEETRNDSSFLKEICAQLTRKFSRSWIGEISEEEAGKESALFEEFLPLLSLFSASPAAQDELSTFIGQRRGEQKPRVQIYLAPLIAEQ